MVPEFDRKIVIFFNLRFAQDPRVPIIGDYDTAGTQMTMAAIEKEVTFFARGKFPAGCIGPVTLVVVPFQLLPASEGVAPDAYDPVVKVRISTCFSV